MPVFFYVLPIYNTHNENTSRQDQKVLLSNLLNN